MTVTLTPLQAFNQGKLAEAIEAATADVQRSPSDINRRNLLCELWCFTGELDRADRQLETITIQNPEAAVSISLFRQLVRAEMARRECWDQGRPPDLLSTPSPLIELAIRAWLARRENNLAEAQQLAAQIEDLRPHPSGSIAGKPFEDFRDLNDFTSFFFEVLTSTGKYYWIPFDSVESVAFHAPERPREVLWCRASMAVHDGPQGDVFIPTTYLGSAQAEPPFQSGQGTDWIELAPSLVMGVGRRMFWTGEQDVSVLDIGELQFSTNK